MLLKCFKNWVFLYLKADWETNSSKDFDRGYDFQQLSYRLCYRWYLSKAETIVSVSFLYYFRKCKISLFQDRNLSASSHCLYKQTKPSYPASCSEYLHSELATGPSLHGERLPWDEIIVWRDLTS